MACFSRYFVIPNTDNFLRIQRNLWNRTRYEWIGCLKMKKIKKKMCTSAEFSLSNVIALNYVTHEEINLP